VICHDHAGEAEIRTALDTPIASGETVYTHRGILTMLQAGSCDVMMPDLQRMGGPTEFLKAGHLCEAFHIPCSAHLFPEMSLGLLASLPGRDGTRLRAIEGTVPRLGHIPAGCAFAPRCPHRFEPCADLPALVPGAEGGQPVRCFLHHRIRETAAPAAPAAV